MGWFSHPPEARLVRLHMADNALSIEGIMTSQEAGHYRLAKASLIEDEDTTVVVDGEAWVPEARVLFVQVLS